MLLAALPQISDPVDPSEPLIPIPGSKLDSYYPSSNNLLQVLSNPRSVRGLLEALMERSGVSKSDLAQRLGVSKRAVGQYLSGENGITLDRFLLFVTACRGRVIVEMDKPGSAWSK